MFAARRLRSPPHPSARSEPLFFGATAALGAAPRSVAGFDEPAARLRSSHCYKRLLASGPRDIFCAPRPLYTSSALGAGFLPRRRRAAVGCAACFLHEKADSARSAPRTRPSVGPTSRVARERSGRPSAWITPRRSRAACVARGILAVSFDARLRVRGALRKAYRVFKALAVPGAPRRRAVGGNPSAS
jgi:hypothetical protein